MTIYGATDNPLSPPGTPPIIYSYKLQFDLERHTLTLEGSHSYYPWHELWIDEPTIGQAGLLEAYDPQVVGPWWATGTSGDLFFGAGHHRAKQIWKVSMN